MQDVFNAAFQLLKLPPPPADSSFCLSVDEGLHRAADGQWKPGAGASQLEQQRRLACSVAGYLSNIDAASA
jgi:hypothetical protein